MSRIFTRSTIMFALGAAGFLHELVLRAGAERPFLLALSGALMGLPFVLAADAKIRHDENEDGRSDRWSHLP